jgi:hypothetical protein
MPTLFELFPLLDGWDYHGYRVPATLVTKGSPQLLLKIEKPGWVLAAVMGCTDAFATLLVKVEGPGGIIHTGVAQPQAYFDIGGVQTDPGGYLQLYFRPNPLSSAGNYYVSIMKPGLSGEPFPYKAPIIIEGYLDTLSTQNAAFLAGVALVAEVKDERIFKESIASYYETINRKQLDATAELTAAVKALTAKLK